MENRPLPRHPAHRGCLRQTACLSCRRSAAANESRRLTLSAISIAISKAQRPNVPADSKTSVSAETKNRIADRIGEEEYRFCMNTLNANQ